MLALLKAAKGKGQGRHVTRSPKRKKFIKDVLTNLSAASILSLHKEFEEKGGLTLEEFVAAMRKYAGACSDNVVDDRLYALEIIELYKMIDCNGDGNMDWEEFTGHIIEVGTATAVSSQNIDQKLLRHNEYKTTRAVDESQEFAVSRHSVTSIVTCDGHRPAMAVIYADSDIVRLFDFPFKSQQRKIVNDRVLRHNTGRTSGDIESVKGGAYISKSNTILTSSTSGPGQQSYIWLWHGTTTVLINRIETLSAVVPREHSVSQQGICCN